MTTEVVHSPENQPHYLSGLLPTAICRAEMQAGFGLNDGPSNGFGKKSLSSCFDLIERAGNSVRRVFLNHLDPQLGKAHVGIFFGLMNRAPGDAQLSGDLRFG